MEAMTAAAETAEKPEGQGRLTQHAQYLLEARIRDNLQSYQKVGTDLVRLKDEAAYDTWGDYVRRQFSMSKSYANQVIVAAIVANIIEEGGFRIPANMRQAHAIKRAVGFDGAVAFWDEIATDHLTAKEIMEAGNLWKSGIRDRAAIVAALRAHPVTDDEADEVPPSIGRGRKVTNEETDEELPGIGSAERNTTSVEDEQNDGNEQADEAQQAERVADVSSAISILLRLAEATPPLRQRLELLREHLGRVLEA